MSYEMEVRNPNTNKFNSIGTYNSLELCRDAAELRLGVSVRPIDTPPDIIRSGFQWWGNETRTKNGNELIHAVSRRIR
jgi:hypothetical protein